MNIESYLSPLLVLEAERVSSLFRIEKECMIMVDDTSTGALLPGEANPSQAQTMEWFQGDKVRPGIAIIQHRYMVNK